MKLLLFGATGQVGRECQRSLLNLGETISCGRDEADFSDVDSLRKVIEAHAPDIIVNAAAYTAVDEAERDESLAMAINATAPGVMAEIAQSIGCLLVHYSTDYVFDGSNDDGYVESDAKHPLNVYGASKLEGERQVHNSGCHYLIFRTSWVYSSHGSNFLLTVLRLAREREQLGIVDDQIGAPTWAATIADVTAIALSQAVSERLTGRFESGLYHLASRGRVSWYGFASQLLSEARQMGLSSGFRLGNIDPITTAEYPTPATRPACSLLRVGRIEKKFNIRLPAWEKALSLCMREVGKRC